MATTSTTLCAKFREKLNCVPFPSIKSKLFSQDKEIKTIIAAAEFCSCWKKVNWRFNYFKIYRNDQRVWDIYGMGLDDLKRKIVTDAFMKFFNDFSPQKCSNKAYFVKLDKGFNCREMIGRFLGTNIFRDVQACAKRISAWNQKSYYIDCVCDCSEEYGSQRNQVRELIRTEPALHGQNHYDEIEFAIALDQALEASPFSDKQVEVFKRSLVGATTAELAKEFDISQKSVIVYKSTVKKYLCDKLGESGDYSYGTV